MAAVDRTALIEHLWATQTNFHALLDALAEDDLRRPSANRAWSVREVLTHVVWSLELLPSEVTNARKGKGMFNYPPRIRDWLNAQLTRLGARGQTLQRLRQRYDVAFAAALATLDDVCDDDFQLGARFWSEGFRDIEGLFTAQIDHLAEHGADIRSAVPQFAAPRRAVEAPRVVAVAE